VVLQQFAHRFAPQHEVHQRHVGYFQKSLADQHRGPVAAVADNLRNAQQRGFKRRGSRGDYCRVAHGEQFVGLIAHVAYVAAIEIGGIHLLIEPGYPGHDELVLRVLFRQFDHERQVVTDFRPAASGQQCDDRTAVESVLGGKFVAGQQARPALVDRIDQRIAFVDRGDLFAAEIVDLEREDDEQSVDVFADFLDA